MMGGVIKFYTLLDSLVSWWPGGLHQVEVGRVHLVQKHLHFANISSAPLAQVIGLHKMLHEDGFDMGFPY